LLVLAVAFLASSAYSQPDLVKRGAAISVKVPSYAEGQKELFALVQKHGGTEADRQRASSEKGRHSGWWRVLVPKSNLDAFLADVRKTGKVYGEKLSLEDRSEEYASLGHRAERLREHQKRLGGILQSTRRLRGGDILFVQERLFRASVDEDMLAQRRETLASTTGTSSVIVNFFEPSPVKEAPVGPIGHVKAAVVDAFRNLALSGIGLIGTLLYLIVYGLIGWVLWLVFRKPIRALYERIRVWLDPHEPKPAPEGNQPLL
jgi:hypothetical protein